MEKKTIESFVVEKIGEYGIVRCREKWYWENGKVCGGTQIWYDVCLEHGDGDIVASYNSIREARKWAKEN
jgi:hypothetical protein